MPFFKRLHVCRRSPDVSRRGSVGKIKNTYPAEERQAKFPAIKIGGPAKKCGGENQNASPKPTMFKSSHFIILSPLKNKKASFSSIAGFKRRLRLNSIKNYKLSLT